MAVQAQFWEALAEHCTASPAVFCYDLMNEPVVPSGQRKPGEWLSGKTARGIDFVQWISLDQADRPRDQIARQWIKTLTTAIRKHDTRHLITVGLLPSNTCLGPLFPASSLTRSHPSWTSSASTSTRKKGKVDEAIKTLKGFSVGRPARDRGDIPTVMFGQ